MIEAVSTGRQRKEFVNFAWSHYRGDPNWVPPLRMNIQELLNFKPHPFYENAEIQTFLARDSSGNVVGRIGAVVDHGHNQTHKEKRGMFGFFECVNDQLVANELFDAAKAWHGERGIQMMRGPLNPALNHEAGLLVEGFDSPPVFMMTYNKPYYGDLIEGYGFQKTQDMYAFYGHVDMIKDLDPKMLFVAEEAARRFNVKVRPISKKNFTKDVETFVEIYNRALPGTWGFVPLSKAEIKHMAAGLKHLIEPSLTAMAEVDGKPVGCVFALLDYNQIIKQIDGRLFPFGLFKLLFGRKKIKRIRMISTNVVPEFQRWGLGLVLTSRLVEPIHQWGVEDAEFSWVLESNHLSRGTLERAGTERYKTYRLYDYEPAEG
ncbi:MAG: N-acetyltransferase [Planctomycetota bacterium]